MASPVLKPSQEEWSGTTRGSGHTDRARTAWELGHVCGHVHQDKHA